MAQISFYLFENSTERQVESACRLCRKILNQHPHIWWYCVDPELQTELDEQLWTFDPRVLYRMVFINRIVPSAFQNNCHHPMIGSCLILTIMHLNKLKIFATLSKLLKIMKRQNRSGERNLRCIVV